jgi:hypothetical protein
LVDVEGLRASLRRESGGNFEGVNGDSEGRSSPQRGASEPRVRSGEIANEPRRDGDLPTPKLDSSENAHLDGHETAGSYVPPSVVEHAIQYGTKAAGNEPGTIVHVFQNVTVVTNATSTRVITVIKTSR